MRIGQDAPEITMKKIRPARYTRPAQFITKGLYSIIVLLI